MVAASSTGAFGRAAGAGSEPELGAFLAGPAGTPGAGLAGLGAGLGVEVGTGLAGLGGLGGLGLAGGRVRGKSGDRLGGAGRARRTGLGGRAEHGLKPVAHLGGLVIVGTLS